MRFKKGGGLDKRFKGAKEKEAALVIIGFVIALVVAVLYFIYEFMIEYMRTVPPFVTISIIVSVIFYTYLEKNPQLKKVKTNHKN